MEGEHTQASIAATAAQRYERDERGKLKVFISYSRDDLDFADQLDIALRLLGFETALDRHAISGGEEWRQRLATLIREADTVVFVLSASSADSEVCAWEVEEALRLRKRIIPVVSRSLSGVRPPANLQNLNYIFFYQDPKSPGSGFGSGASQLVEALTCDLEWVRENTRLLLRATEWEAGSRAENRLLTGGDIVAAKAWAARRPKGASEPTALHLGFLRASEEAEDARLMAQRKQLEEMTAAQNERAKALRAAEQALNRTLRLQKRQAWGGSVIIVVLAMIGWWAYGVIIDQRAVAREAAREDIRGQIVAYAAAFGSTEMDVVEGLSTSPYTTPLVQKLRQKKNLVEAIVDAHQQVLDFSKGVQRPLLSTSMNGQIYLHQQPATRRKRVLAVSADDPGAGINKLQGPPHDVDAMVAALIESGFSQSEVITLHNPVRVEIEEAIANIAQTLRRKSSAEAKGQFARLAPAPFIRVGLGLVPVDEIPAPDNTLLLVFFSGHGVHVAGADYIIPRLSLGAATLNGPEDIENSALSVNWLVRTLGRSAAASVLILDTHFPTASFNQTR
jgi:TIR domain